MTTPDLRERFDRAAHALPDVGGDLDAVVARGRARLRRRRAAGVAAGAAVLVILATVTPRLIGGDAPIAVDPVDEAPGPTAEDDGNGEATGPVLTWDHSRYGPTGVVRHASPGAEPARTSTAPVQRAVGTPAGGLVTQEEVGAPILHLAADGTPRELAPAARAQRLLTVDDGTVWFTRRTEPAEGGEDQELLLSVSLSGGAAAVEHGSSASMEGFTDALAVSVDDTLAWLSCHLQCRVFTGGLDGLVGPGEPTPLTEKGAWFGALAFAPGGDRLAVVEGPDPVIGGTSEVVLLDTADGGELQRIALGVALELSTAAVSFTPDGLSLLVGDHTRALVVTDLEGDAPRVEPMTGGGGVTLHPPQDEGASDAEPPVPDDARDVALTFAAEELGWPDAVAAELDDVATRPEGTIETAAVGLRRGPDEPMASLHLRREGPSGRWRITGGGHHAEGPDDPDGWWNGVQASDGVIRLGGQAPAWGGDRMTAWVLDGNEDRRSSGPVEVGADGTFEIVLEVPEQRDQGVTLLLVTLAGEEVTSFVILGIPPGEFAAN